jgi:hypothetical protein
VAAGLVVVVGLMGSVAAQTRETPTSPSEGWLVDGVRAQEAEAEKSRAAAASRPVAENDRAGPLPGLPRAVTPVTGEGAIERLMQRWLAPRTRTPAAESTRPPNPFLPAESPGPSAPPSESTPAPGPPVAPSLAEIVPDPEAVAPAREPHRPPPPERERERYYRQLPKRF